MVEKMSKAFDIFKVKKPYDKPVTEAMKKGSSKINLNQKDGYYNWLYLSRINKRRKVFNIQTARHNQFLLTINKPIKKKKNRVKYTVYEIMSGYKKQRKKRKR